MQRLNLNYISEIASGGTVRILTRPINTNLFEFQMRKKYVCFTFSITSPDHNKSLEIAGNSYFPGLYKLSLWTNSYSITKGMIFCNKFEIRLKYC